MRRRKLVIGALAAAVVAAAALAAGARDGSAALDATKGGGTTIEFLSIQQPTEGWPLIMATLTKEYGKGVTFKNTFVNQAQLQQRIQLLSGQDALPVLYNTPQPDVLQQMARRGQVLDIEKAFKNLSIYKELTPAAVSIIKKLYGGKMLALPLEFNIEGFWYNKRLFAQAGVKPPTTWAQFLSVAAALDAKGIQPLAASGMQGWPITRLIGNYLFSTVGADALERVKTGKAKLTDARYVAAAQAVADLGAKGYFGEGVASLDYGPAQDVFLQGKAAMFYMGSWALRDLNNPEVNKIGAANVGFFTFPRVAGGSGPAKIIPMNGGQPTSINAKKVTPEVRQWLRYVARNYGDRSMSKLGSVTGFKVHKSPRNLSALTTTVTQQLAAAKQPVLWFEARFSAKAQDTAVKNVTLLVAGDLSARDFMAKVQEAVSSK